MGTMTMASRKRHNFWWGYANRTPTQPGKPWNVVHLSVHIYWWARLFAPFARKIYAFKVKANLPN